jgi:hypothetical protein
MKSKTSLILKLVHMLFAWNFRLTFAFLALILFGFVACEEEEVPEPAVPVQDINNNEGYFVARAGEDRSILTGDTVNLSAEFARNQRNNTFKWRFIERPPNSQASISSPQSAAISFQADQPGTYLLELAMFFEQYSAYDTVRVSAFTITDISGSYTDPPSGANGIIRQFLVFQDNLYAVGDFTHIGGAEAFGFARYNGVEWVGLGADLLMDQVYQVIEFQDQLVISGSSREVAADGVIKFVSWREGKQQILGFVDQGPNMAVYQDALYMNFDNRLARWDGRRLDYPNMPTVENITHIEVINDILFLRGYSNEQCVNSSEDVWVYNCEARGFLWQFDGSNWAEYNSTGPAGCLNIGPINWDYHIWINSEPDFKWDIMEGHQGRVYFDCGYIENGIFREIPYPFEKIYDIKSFGNQDLYISGRNQKTGDYTGIMKWDGQQWYTLGDGVNGQIATIQEYKGRLYIGGSFNRSAADSQLNYTVWEER